jgi:hypothetical protein
MTDPTEILERWQQDEQRFRLYGQEGPAQVLQHCREELSAWWRERELSLLTVEEAVRFSSYSESGLQKLRECGKLSDLTDENGRRRYILGELPRKARRKLRLELDSGEPDLAGEMLHSRAKLARH